jgi:hypothetical protein
LPIARVEQYKVMKANPTLFKEASNTSVKRFYHIDFFYFLLLAVSNGAKDEYETFVFSSKNESELLSIAKVPHSKDKFKSEYIISSVISEALSFGLISIGENRSLMISKSGVRVLDLVRGQNFKEAEIEICSRMEEFYGRLTTLIKSFYEINKTGLVIFPKPSPKALGFNSNELLHGSNLKNYCEQFAKYTHDEIRRFINGFELNQNEIFFHLYDSLTEHLENIEYKEVTAINFPREIKRIMYSFYLNKFFDGKFDRVSFDVWIKRAKELRLLNFSEFFPGAQSLIIYPTSKIITGSLQSSNFIKMGNNRVGENIMRYEPQWIQFRDEFMKNLWNNYVELRKIRDDYWISIQDLRDLVCFKLQLNEYLFSDFLTLAYRESMNEVIRQFKISLEVDRSPEERTFVNSKRYPINIDGKPINIIGIKMR